MTCVTDTNGDRIIIKAPKRIQDLAQKYLIPPNHQNKQHENELSSQQEMNKHSFDYDCACE